MIPLPSELILPFAGFLVSDTEPDRADHRPALELLDRGRRRDDRQHARLARRLRDRRVGRPAVPRALRQVPAHPAARDRARRLVLRSATARRPCSSAGCCRSSGRSSASRPASRGCRSRHVHRLLDRRAPSSGRSCSSMRAPSSARTGRRSATRSSRSTWLIAVVVVVAAVLLFIWWRIGMPGRPGRADAEEPTSTPEPPTNG